MISFLEVDDIQQILVSIRVLNIDRGRARSQGINYTVDGTRLSLGHFTDAPDLRFPNARPVAVDAALNPSQAGLTAGNLVGAYVSSSTAIPGALEYLQRKAVAQSVAEPNVLTLTGEEAVVLIGGEVPIPTTSFNTSQTVGGNIVPITSFTYQNVGITVQIEPRVHHNKEVTLTVQVEISQIGAFIETSGGQNQPIIGTRQIQTVIRLRDGETNLLAGLMAFGVMLGVTALLPSLMNTESVWQFFGMFMTAKGH